MAPLTILLASPRGFCAGVERAIEIVEEALRRHGPPVYVRHQIVHNTHVVADLERKGAVFVEELAEVPEGALVVFSAHGVAPAVKREARGRGLDVLDATCPLVTKVHVEAGPPRPRGLRAAHGRPRRPRRGPGHDGRRAGAHPPGGVGRRRRGARPPAGHPGGLHDADHAGGRRHPRDHRRDPAPLPRRPGAARRGHLLRHHQPPGRDQGPGRTRRPRAGGRQSELLELPAHGRGGARRRRARGPPDRGRGRPRRRLARRRRRGRPHLRCLRARRPRARGDRPPLAHRRAARTSRSSTWSPSPCTSRCRRPCCRSAARLPRRGRPAAGPAPGTSRSRRRPRG